MKTTAEPTREKACETAIYSALGQYAPHFDLRCLAQCDSTNTALLNAAAPADERVPVLIAERQTAGRGRRGRDWQSWPQQAGASLTFSALWRFTNIAHSPASLTLVAGLAVACAIESLGGKGVRLKWPNDVLWRGAKLAGILVELLGKRPHHSPAVVVGIGLNLQLPADADRDLAAPLADLAQVLTPLPPQEIILAQILIELDRLFALWQQAGLAPVQAAWQQRDHFAGQNVRLIDGDQVMSGRHAGIDADGALLLQTESGLTRFVCGELSLRAASCPPPP